MQEIIPAFLFNKGATEPVNFYLSVFKDSKILSQELMPDGSIFAANISLNGVEFLAISGGPDCEHTLATSFMIKCHSQEEVDYYWDRLVEGGGEHSYCGWLKDRFGVSWQVSPVRFMEMMRDADPTAKEKLMQVMMQSQKLCIADFEAVVDAK